MWAPKAVGSSAPSLGSPQEMGFEGMTFLLCALYALHCPLLASGIIFLTWGVCLLVPGLFSGQPRGPGVCILISGLAALCTNHNSNMSLGAKLLLSPQP